MPSDVPMLPPDSQNLSNMPSLRVGILGIKESDLSPSCKRVLDFQKSTLQISWLTDASIDSMMIEPKHPYDLILIDCRVKREIKIKDLAGDALILGLIDEKSSDVRGQSDADFEVMEDMAAMAMQWAIRERMFWKQVLMERDQLHRQLEDASYTIEMADVASTVLHNVGNVLNSVNVAVKVMHELVTRSSVILVHQIAELLRGRQEDCETFLTQDPKGKRIPSALVKLGSHLLEEQKTVLKEIEGLVRNIDHMKQIILSHQTMAKSRDLGDPFSIVELIEQAVELSFQPEDAKWIKITREYQTVPEILIDKHQLLQILVNLLRNAKQAMQLQGGLNHLLTILAECMPEDDSSVVLTIRDTGIGIAPEHLSRMFIRGFTTKHDGNGIGLHSSKVSVDRMGGLLRVSSDGIGTGATFTLVLPGQKKAKQP
jgi:signal transduction histidine kinase